MLLIHKNKYCLLILFGFSFLCPTVSQATSFTSDTGGDLTSNIYMTVNMPTCTTSVNDPNFNSVNQHDIENGSVTTKTINIILTCSGLLTSYTIKLSSSKGIYGQNDDGIIKGDNSTVGYHLTWADATVSNKSSSVNLNTTLTPNTPPSTESFNIPINIKPVAISASGKVSSGPANSSLNVSLLFN